MCEARNVLTEVSDGVLVRQSGFCQSNAVVVVGSQGVLLVDPGVDGDDLRELADDLATLGQVVVAGFSTHLHWDHLLWSEAFGDGPRFATARCADTATAWLSDARAKAARLAPGTSADILGILTPLPPNTQRVPWNGPEVQILEHQAHAPGHAALLIKSAGVLIAGDMLSDVEIPLLDLRSGTHDPLEDYRQGLEVLAQAASTDVVVLVPGHGGLAGSDDIPARIDADRAYLAALRHDRDPADSRVGPLARYGRDWLPGEHLRQVHAVQR
jgi:glyoxylase-like metal-dependent hydrolase (beta-lactamase superfamily II)